MEGGEAFRLVFSGRDAGLRYPPLRLDGIDIAPSSLAKVWTSPDPGTYPDLDVLWYDPKELVGENDEYAEFILAMRSRDTKQFTRRPKFLYAEITREVNRKKQQYDVWDFHYLPGGRWNRGQHYPFARLAMLPWFDADARNHDTYASMDLWLSYEAPTFDHTFAVQIGDNAAVKNIGADKFTYSRTEDTIFVRVRANDGGKIGRWLVSVPRALSARHSYFDDGTGVDHEFQLHPNQAAESMMQVISIADLKSRLKAQRIPQIQFGSQRIGR